MLLLPLACNDALDDTRIKDSNEIHFNVSGLIANTLYYWKVAVDDSHNGVAESEVRTFTTQQ
jgi:hypothetical protein